MDAGNYTALVGAHIGAHDSHSAGTDIYAAPDANSTSDLNSLNTTNMTSNLNSSLNLRRGGPDIPEEIQVLLDIHANLNDVLPYFMALGIVGNVIAAFAFMVTPLKKNSLSHYLTALAIADIVNLTACMVTWMSRKGLDIYNTVGVCQVTSFALLMSRFLTVWYLLSAHIERLLVHSGRPTSKQWCTVFRTKCIILTIFIFSLVAFLHYIWSHVVMIKYGRRMCIIMEEISLHINRLRRGEIVMAHFVPMLVMLLLDVALIYKIVRKMRRRPPVRSRSPFRKSPLPIRKKSDRSMRSTVEDYNSAENGEVRSLAKRGSLRQNNNGTDTKNREAGNCPASPSTEFAQKKTRATILCILVGVIFMALTFPSAYLRARVNFADNGRRMPLTNYEVYLMQVFEQIVLFNGIYKVPLYVLFLENFRKAVVYMFIRFFKKLFCCCRKKETPAVTTV